VERRFARAIELACEALGQGCAANDRAPSEAPAFDARLHCERARSVPEALEVRDGYGRLLFVVALAGTFGDRIRRASLAVADARRGVMPEGAVGGEALATVDSPPPDADAKAGLDAPNARVSDAPPLAEPDGPGAPDAPERAIVASDGARNAAAPPARDAAPALDRRADRTRRTPSFELAASLSMTSRGRFAPALVGGGVRFARPLGTRIALHAGGAFEQSISGERGFGLSVGRATLGASFGAPFGDGPFGVGVELGGALLSVSPPSGSTDPAQAFLSPFAAAQLFARLPRLGPFDPWVSASLGVLGRRANVYEGGVLAARLAVASGALDVGVAWGRF
jgi:hypothetical protein